jgi:hypothetical protein
VADARVRLEELRGCALDESGVDNLCARLAAGGAAVRRAVLRDDTHILGWTVDADA